MNFNYIRVPGNHFKPLRGEKWTRHIEKESVHFGLQLLACALEGAEQKKNRTPPSHLPPSTHLRLQRLLNQYSFFYMRCCNNINQMAKAYGIEVVVSASPEKRFLCARHCCKQFAFFLSSSRTLRLQVSQISPILQTRSCCTGEFKLLAQRYSKWQSQNQKVSVWLLSARY